MAYRWIGLGLLDIARIRSHPVFKSQQGLEQQHRFGSSVQVSDQASDGPRTDQAQITLNLEDLNEFTPQVQDQLILLHQDLIDGDLIGQIQVSDDDATAGNEAGLFALDAATGELTLANAAALDLVAIAGHQLQVQVSDQAADGARTGSATIRLGSLTGSPTLVEGEGLDLTLNSPDIVSHGWDLNGDGLFLEHATLFADVLALDGEGGYVAVTQSAATAVAHDQRTIELTFRADDASRNDKAQILFEDGDRARGYVLYLFDGNLYASAWDRIEGWRGQFLTTPVESGRWNHAALTFEPGQLTGYLNGVEFGRDETIGDLMGAIEEEIGIGAGAGGMLLHDRNISTGDTYLIGQIADLRIWDHARDAAAIHADIGLPMQGDEAGLILAHGFVAPTNSRFSDITGNGGTALMLGSAMAQTNDIRLTLDWAGLQAQGINDDGDYTPTLRSVQADGTVTEHAIPLTITNKAPELTVIDGGTTATVGQSYTLTLAASDPGADTLAYWEVDWGDGFVLTVTGDKTQVSHIYTTADTWTITIKAGDEDGQYTAPQTIQVESVVTAARSVKFTPPQDGSTQGSGLADVLERLKNPSPAVAAQSLENSSLLSGLGPIGKRVNSEEWKTTYVRDFARLEGIVGEDEIEIVL